MRVWIPGTPKGQPRPRAFSMGGRVRVYDPSTAEGWKAEVALAVRDIAPSTPLTGPLKVDLVFYLPRPKAHYRTGRYAGILKDSAPHWHTGKPDIDNLTKAVLDALSQLRFWEDDSQVCAGQRVKEYAGDQGPGCWLRVEELHGGQHA